MGKTEAKEAAAEQNGGKERTCFVVIGFGKKTDYYTGRTLNLDVTYKKLIKPAFERVGVRCFRAIDVNRVGSIDKLMYYWIYHADFVVADLSTMNANVFYELGVRHAQKKSTTLLMVENGVFEKNRLPFDLSHMIIRGYQHLGDDIDKDHADKFVDDLAKLLQGLIDKPVEEALEADSDSPVYTYLEGMTEPKYIDLKKEFEKAQAKEAEKAEADPEDIKRQSLAKIIDAAEAAKKDEQFKKSIVLFETAIEIDEKDIFLRQRLALVTYKQVEENDRDDKAANQEAIEVLKQAEAILIDHCRLKSSTDPETLGLAGAINKRLYARTGASAYFEKSVYYYEKGFYITGDYYNGINVSYMYTVKAAELAEEGKNFNAIVHYGHANLIRKKVAEVCRELVDDESFGGRGDEKWIYQTLAQAYLGMGDEAKAEGQMGNIEAYSEGKFDMTTFRDQNEKLIQAMETFERLVGTPSGPQELGETPAMRDRDVAVPTAVSEPAAREARLQPVVSSSPGGPITIDLGDYRGKPVKSLECKVEFG